MPTPIAPPKVPETRFNTENRIPVDELGGLEQMIFSKAKFGGPDLARRLDMRPNTLWLYFNESGVPVSIALRTADAMVDWSIELLRRANLLRAAAYRVSELPPEPRYRQKRIYKSRKKPYDGPTDIPELPSEPLRSLDPDVADRQAVLEEPAGHFTRQEESRIQANGSDSHP